MPLRGTAFVIMWHDITSGGDTKYNHWHTHEHMPERIALPGFLRARRGFNKSLDRQRYFTLYECASLESVMSPEYQRSLNYPTAWTRRVAPEFRNFKRMSCELASSSGKGVGGSISTFRAGLGNPSEDSIKTMLTPAIAAILERPSATSAHLAFARPERTNGETTEVKIRPAMTEPDFSLVIVVEGIGLKQAVEDQPAIEAILAQAGLDEVIGQSYDMAYMLEQQS